MLNGDMGAEARLAGGPAIAVPAGRAGCAVYGPYRPAPGRHVRVTYRIEAAATPPGADPTVAIVDIVANAGRSLVAARLVRASEVAGGAAVALDASVPEAVALEYRVHSTGAAALLIADDPAVASIDGHGLEGRANPGTDGEAIMAEALLRGERAEDLLALTPPTTATDPAEPAQVLRAAFAGLRPHRVRGWEKERIGSTRDGGYVCIPDFDGIDAVLSLGINDNVDFDEDVAARGPTVHQYDHTVEDPRPDDGRMIFHKQMIGTTAGPGVETLPALIRRHDRGAARPNIFLKIDIENWEWPVLDTIPAEDLGRIRQITGEFHAFEFLGYPAWRARMLRVLSKLSPRFALVHVHANNYAAAQRIEGMLLPNVMEFTFVNRACYAVEPSGEHFPTPLDMACAADRDDYDLGDFLFRP